MTVVVVVPGPASVELGKRIAKELKARMVSVEFRRFPDGESRLRLEGDVKGEDAIVVQTTGPPQNENLIQLFLLADTIKDLGAKSITAVVPYFAYSRQDKRFRAGECFSVKTIVSLLHACGVGRVLTVNSHNPVILKMLAVPVEDLSAIGLLAEHFKKHGFAGAFAVSMGKKGLDTAVEAGKVLGGNYDYVPTQRDVVTGNVTLEKKSLAVKDKTVVVVDDIISSGGTMIKTVAWVKEQGAEHVYVGCVHPLLSDEVIEKIVKAGADEIVGTDSVPNKVSKVTVAPLIVQALKK
jgi:ribose-phosphate pyrophosphokinase